MVVSLTRRQNLVFKDRVFTEPLLLVECVDILFQNCTFTDKGFRDRVAITIKSSKNIGIDACSFEGCSAIYCFKSSHLNIVKCDAKNISAPMPRGQFCQLNDCKGPVQISGNRIVCEIGKSFVEDVINCYKSYASKEAPITISDNYIECPGATSRSGGGIMLG